MERQELVSKGVIIPSHTNQDIKREESKSLLGSSNSSYSALRAKSRSMSKAGVGKECPCDKWYYMFLRKRELKQYLAIFSGKTPVIDVETREEMHFRFRVFSYTTADHKRRFNQCEYSKEEYEERKAAANISREAFRDGDINKLNDLVLSTEVGGDGYLFVCAPLSKLNYILSSVFPRKYLIVDKQNYRPIEILGKEMEEFIYLYESMPYKIELMEHSLDEYTLKHKKIRITSGLFSGKVGRIMRLHRNNKLVFAFGNMTIAISNIHAFPYEFIE